MTQSRNVFRLVAILLAALLLPQTSLEAQQDDAPPPRRETRRDGDTRPAGPRDGDPRPPGPRDGDRPADPDRPRDPGRPPGFGGPFPGGPPPGFFEDFPHPLLMFFDTDRDGLLSAEEIAGAPDVLKKFDANTDGKLTRFELMPQFPFGGSPGRGPGPRGAGGPPPGGGPPGEGPQGFGDFARRRPGDVEGADPAVVARIMTRDQDADGLLRKEELPAAMHRLFELGDENDDGQLSKSEIEQALQKLPKPTIPPAGVRKQSQ